MHYGVKLIEMATIVPADLRALELHCRSHQLILNRKRIDEQVVGTAILIPVELVLLGDLIHCLLSRSSHFRVRCGSIHGRHIEMADPRLQNTAGKLGKRLRLDAK